LSDDEKKEGQPEGRTVKLSPQDVVELRLRFQVPGVKEEGQAAAMQAVNEVLGSLAVTLYERLPHSRERSLALTKLEECSSWANRAALRYPGHFRPKEGEDGTIPQQGR